MTPDPQALVEGAPLTAARQRAHRLVARNEAGLVEALFGRIAALPAAEPLRPTEVGLVMVRGRVGGDGQRFNLGELPVARAALRLAGGPVGVGYVAGRNPRHAELAALADAMVQSDAWREIVETAVLGDLEKQLGQRHETAARKAAATRVEFFTMVRTRAEQ